MAVLANIGASTVGSGSRSYVGQLLDHARHVMRNKLSALAEEVACSLDSCGNVFPIVFAVFPSPYGLPRRSNSERAHVSLWLPGGGFSALDNTQEQVRAECPQWPRR